MRALRLLIYFILFLGLLSLGIMFGTENTQEVILTLFKFSEKYTFTLHAPLWVVALASFVLGAILSILISFAEMIKMQFEIRRLKKKARKNTEETETYYEEEELGSDNEPEYEEVTEYEEVEDYDTPQESDEIL
jgi:uncharacterized integral membrane protein